MNFSAMVMHFGIPVVEVLDPVSDPKKFLEQIRALEDGEGVIVAWENGKRVKAKSDWYVRIHRAKDALVQEKNILEMIIEEKLDDVKGFLPVEDLARVENYERAFWQGVSDTAAFWRDSYHDVRREFGNDRKLFALEGAPNLEPNLKSAVFRFWDQADHNWQSAVLDVIRRNLGSQTRVDDVRHLHGAPRWRAAQTGDE
jgi:RNA ligase